MVSEEIGLNRFLEDKGYKVVETDLGEWIVQLAKERPSHITAPALHKTKEEVAELLSRELGRPVPPDIGEMVKIARLELRRHFIEADAGISGANLAVAKSGTLVIVSNEGNARLVTSLPPLHIALVTTEKFVGTLEQAVSLVKALTMASSGIKLSSYVSFITGPSRTTDIEKELVTGVHGPGEVHIIIIDNGRLAVAGDESFKDALYCLKCGGCMLVCPVFQAVGGYNFGGPVYPGGIGLMLTAVTRSIMESSSLLSLCADCKKCEEFCPVGIKTGELLLRLKNLEGPSLREKTLSRLFLGNEFIRPAAGVLSLLQKAWREDDRLKGLPGRWARGKSFPALNPKRPVPAEGKKGPKIYLFEGCLVRLFFPRIRDSAAKTLSALDFNVVTPAEQACCGAPSRHLGDEKGLKRLIAANLASFAKESPDYILTVCPAGHSMLKNTYPELDPSASRWISRIRDFTEFLVSQGLAGDLQRKNPKKRGDVFYHYPCHYVNELGLEEEPPKLLKTLGYSPRHEGKPYACCGFCGMFSFRNPEISARLWEKKKASIQAYGPSLIVTDCPGCVFQLTASLGGEGAAPIVLHTAEACAETIE